MRKAEVYHNHTRAGVLIQHSPQLYEFTYDDAYFHDEQKPSISRTLLKTQQSHTSAYLFPFFFNMLSEGVNRNLQTRQLKIDERDFFGLLLATASEDTIGAITVNAID